VRVVGQGLARVVEVGVDQRQPPERGADLGLDLGSQGRPGVHRPGQLGGQHLDRAIGPPRPLRLTAAAGARQGRLPGQACAQGPGEVSVLVLVLVRQA
jgi:hypothetical protein